MEVPSRFEIDDELRAEVEALVVDQGLTRRTAPISLPLRDHLETAREARERFRL